jgi:uncharacterized protein (DUF2336 family)
MTMFKRSRRENPIADTRSLLDDLVDTLETGGLKQRLRILKQMTDLFMAGGRGYSREQVAIFDDVLQQLSSELENDARAQLARRMADIDYAPPGLIRHFAFDDEIEVAGPVLARSSQLSEEDLIETARTKSQAHLLAIAQRMQLSEDLTDVLIERGGHRVARQVTKNRGARFSLAGYGKLTARAQYDRKLALALGARGDLPRQCFLKLLESASASVRERLEAAHPEYAEAIRETVDELAVRLQQEAREQSQEHADAARKAERRFRAQPVTDAHVHTPAVAQDFDKAAVSLAKLGGFPIDLVERALVDSGEDMLLVLAKAAGCSWVTARELLQMQSAGRNLTAEDLRLSSERYRKLQPETARNILRFHEQRIKMRAQDIERDDSYPAVDIGLARVAANA